MLRNDVTLTQWSPFLWFPEILTHKHNEHRNPFVTYTTSTVQREQELLLQTLHWKEAMNKIQILSSGKHVIKRGTIGAWGKIN